MKLKEIKTSEIFTINETPTYPKLRTDYGYIDMRDQIRIKHNLNPNWNLRIMSKLEVITEFEIKESELKEWIENLLK